MTISPNLKIGRDWRSTLNLAFSVLRRIVFLTPDDFSFGDFDPQTNFNGMAGTVYTVNKARYLKIFKMLWFSIDISATLAAVFTTNITVTMPATANGGTGGYQGFVGVGENAGVGELSAAQIQNGTNLLNIYRQAFGAYTAGTWHSRINGFMEVI